MRSDRLTIRGNTLFSSVKPKYVVHTYTVFYIALIFSRAKNLQVLQLPDTLAYLPNSSIEKSSYLCKTQKTIGKISMKIYIPTYILLVMLFPNW